MGEFHSLMLAPLCSSILHKEGNHGRKEVPGLRTQEEMGTSWSSALLWAPHVASSRPGAIYSTGWEHCKFWVMLSQAYLILLGWSLLTAPQFSCKQAPAITLGTALEYLRFSLAPRPNSQQQHLPHFPSLLPSTSTSNKLLIAAHPIKGLLHVNNSWLLVRAVGGQARQHQGWGFGELRGVKCNKEKKKSIA